MLSASKLASPQSQWPLPFGYASHRADLAGLLLFIILLTQVNVITVGPPARRTRLLFGKALGREIQVGIIMVESQDSDPKRWWTTSPGVRTVISEGIAYGYARVFFRAPRA